MPFLRRPRDGGRHPVQPVPGDPRHTHAALIDPGGDLSFTPLSTAIGRFIRLQDLDYLVASHQDPDIIASLSSWLSRTNATVVCSRLWSRFVPHLIPGYLGGQVNGRCMALPDSGGDIPMGDMVFKAVPAHFLHSVGNIQFYDPVSRILFSGDMGASVMDDPSASPFVEDFEAHVPHMEGTHRRYMVSRKVCSLGGNMVRRMQVDMLVPQHGPAFRGPEMIGWFLHWVSTLPCGIDLLGQEHYRVA
jgi:flavorubredoxin